MAVLRHCARRTVSRRDHDPEGAAEVSGARPSSCAGNGCPRSMVNFSSAYDHAEREIRKAERLNSRSDRRDHQERPALSGPVLRHVEQERGPVDRGAEEAERAAGLPDTGRQLAGTRRRRPSSRTGRTSSIWYSAEAEEPLLPHLHRRRSRPAGSANHVAGPFLVSYGQDRGNHDRARAKRDELKQLQLVDRTQEAGGGRGVCPAVPVCFRCPPIHEEPTMSEQGM